MNLKKSAAVSAAAIMCWAGAAKADAVLDWNAIMQTTLVGQNAFNETRIAAITQLAVFEALNAITGEYQPYVGTLSAPRSASIDAAAVAAAHKVLRFYIPAKAADLDAARVTSLAAIVDGTAKQSGITAGESAADALLALRTDDGALPVRSHLPTSSEPGQWQLTPSCPATGGGFAHWGGVRPLGLDPDAITNGRWFRLPPPPALTSKRYEHAFNEVKKLGARDSAYRSPEKSDVARFYAAVLTIRTWNPVVTQLATAESHSPTHTARALALVNMAMSDALVAVVDNKYPYTFWRPETAIRAGDNDGNRRTVGDPAFIPFVTTPCHPSYGSAHASAAYAARIVIESVYGRRGHDITMSSAVVPGVTLHYRSIKGITDDIDDARVYGGIHYRFDQDAGASLGTRVGALVLWNNLRRAH
jgi:hypothetical protein